MSRVKGLLGATSSVFRLAVEDPLWLTVQAGRRLPGGLRSRLGTLVTTRTRAPVMLAWGNLLRGDGQAAALALGEAPTGGALDAALRVHTGQRPDPRSTPAATLRAAWVVGDLSVLDELAQDPGVPPKVQRAARDHLELLDAEPRRVLTRRAPGAHSARDGGSGARVVHVLTNSLPWTRSGYTLRTHAIVTAQARQDIAPVAITRPGYPASIGRPWFRDSDTLDGVTYHRCAPVRLPATEGGRLDLWAAQIADRAVRHRATVLHTTTHYVNALATEAAASSLGLPWVYEVRGQLERTWAAGRAAAGDPDPLGSVRYARWHEAEAAVAARADAVVTLSQAMADDLVARGVDRDKITLVPNGIDVELVTHTVSAGAARASLGLPAAGFWVGSVTSVVDYEGLEVLVEAIALARRSGHDIRGAIVGDGVAYPALRQRVADLGLDAVMRLPGRLSQAEARRWLQALDTVVIPRTDEVVTRYVPPMKLIEALGARRPVIVSDLPAMQEIVDADVSALVVPPGDARALSEAIVRLAHDESLVERLAANGRRIATTRTWDALIERYRDVYAAAAGRERE